MEPHAKRKRKNKDTASHLFPIENIAITTKDAPFVGHFTGTSVEIVDASSMAKLYDNGCFGVGLHTKSAPAVLLNKKNTAPNNDTISKVNQTNDRLQEQETLVLFLEEAFFLHYSLKCLRIVDLSDRELKTEQIFQRFTKLKPKFLLHFVAYLYLRSKNWIVKSGLKFGGDFLLYKEGPRYYHASYIVLVRQASDGSRIPELSNYDMQGHNRIAEASKKELLIIEVRHPSGLTAADTGSLECLMRLNQFTASEMTPKRFNFNQERC